MNVATLLVICSVAFFPKVLCHVLAVCPESTSHIFYAEPKSYHKLNKYFPYYNFSRQKIKEPCIVMAEKGSQTKIRKTK